MTENQKSTKESDSTVNNITLYGFENDKFGELVAGELFSSGVQVRHFEKIWQHPDEVKCLPKEWWHNYAWKNRLLGNEKVFLDDSKCDLDAQDWMNLLHCLDRIFVDKRALRESTGYIGTLIDLAHQTLSVLEPGEPVLFIQMPHFTRDLAIAVAANARNHPVYAVRPTLMPCRVWVSPLRNTQPVGVVDFGRSELFGESEIHSTSKPLANSKEQNKKVLKLQQRDVISAVRLSLRRFLRITGLLSIFSRGRKNKLSWPASHYWNYLGHWGMVSVKLSFALSRYRVRKKLREVTNDEPLPEKFIYFPLHYQPERTTVPEAGLWQNQILLIHVLAEFCGQYNEEQLSVVVKEHPRQGIGDLRQALFRSAEFYDCLSRLPNVRLVGAEFGSSTLIGKARVVATPNGSSAWEALLLGVPSMTTAVTWHSNCRASPSVDSHADIPTALRSLLKMTRLDVDSSLEEFLRGRSFLIPGVFSEEHLPSDVDTKELSRDMAYELRKLLDPTKFKVTEIEQRVL